MCQTIVLWANSETFAKVWHAWHLRVPLAFHVIQKKKKKKCQEFELIDELIFLLIHTVMTKLCGQSSGIIFPKLFYICIVTNFDSVATRY